MWKLSRISAAALAALLAATTARAASYELASEWSAIDFDDGAKPTTLFTHLQDADLFEHMQEFETRTSTDGSSLDVYVPLYGLALPKSGAAGRTQGALKSVILLSRVSPYKMLVQLDKEHHRHQIVRPPDFTVEESTRATTLLLFLGLNPAHPNNFLIMVEPENPEAGPKGLSDIELAAIASLDAPQRTEWVGQCGGEPGSAAALDCWRAKVADLLSLHKNEGPGQDFSSFEQRYMQHRLSAKSYEQFQLAAQGSDKLALARDWHELVIGQDIDANAAAAAKNAAAKAPAPAPVAAVPARTPKAKPRQKPRPAAVVVSTATQRPAPSSEGAAAQERGGRASPFFGWILLVLIGAAVWYAWF